MERADGFIDIKLRKINLIIVYWQYKIILYNYKYEVNHYDILPSKDELLSYGDVFIISTENN